MCGIAGIVHFEKQPINNNDLQIMAESAVHRGPDGGGIAMLAEYPDFGILISSPCEGTLSELMRRSVVTVCNDTGVMHIGGASGASVVAVFGPTESSRWKPVNSSVTAVSSDDGDISSVKVDDVFNAIESIVAGVREVQGRPLS